MDLQTWLRSRPDGDPPRDAALADYLGITPAAVRHKANGLRAVQHGECPLIERYTEGAVTCDELRNDVDWDRDDDGRVTGYRVRFATDASVGQASTTDQPANTVAAV